MTIRAFLDKIPRIDQSAYVDEQSSVIGEVTIGAESSVWPMTVLRGDMMAITIGARTNIQDGSVLHVSHESEYGAAAPLVIGNSNTVGHSVTLHGCTVEDYCLIGIGALVLDHAVIRSQTIVGAGSLVTPGKELDGGLWTGRPAKRVRALTDKEFEMFEYLAAHYVKTANQYRSGA